MGGRAKICGVLLVILLSVGLMGCSGGGGTASQPISRTSRFDALEFTLTTRTLFAPGENVPLTLVVKNTSNQTVTITLGPPESDARVSQGGNTVWRWSDGKAFPAVIGTLRLLPGESRTYTLDWDQRDRQGAQVPRGTYQVKAWFNGYPDNVQFVQPPNPENDWPVGPILITIR